MLIITKDYTIPFRYINNIILTKGSIITKYHTKDYRTDVAQYYYFFIVNYHTAKRDWSYDDNEIPIAIPKSCAAILKEPELTKIKLLYGT